MFSYKQDDIVALATPPGFGALAVIRFSGTNLSSLYTKFTSKAKPIDRRAVFSKIHHPLTRHVLDEAVVTFFKTPNSYTGEDLMEISCHGGESVPNNIIKSSIESGVRAAEPGEFSFRAFMNGKMDLIQAEAVSSLIYSKSSLSADISLNQIGGKISRLFNGIKSKVLTILTIIENELNFSENEITLTTYQQIKLEVQDVCNKIFDVFETTTFGKKIFTGIRVVIYGKPNSGKSSLFNAILGYDRAIVSSQAGTTRDTIEAWIELAGVSVCLIDTAGVWESRDYLERLGIEKAHSELDNADVCILVDEKDPTEFLHNGRPIKNTNHFILAQTKVDRLLEQGNPSNNILQTSSKNNTGIRELLTALSTYIKDNINIPDRVDKVLTSQRQRIILERAYVVLKETLHLISQGVETDIIASQLREFINLIDEIVGEVTNEDVIHNIFQNFCVGK